ncbi:hypothetical protein CCC_01292 [Paramagnetospirillum magnetotacticum MS-1]|uniref:Lipoprotein n=1 Tax=Paramagnetospirillum magnetotacticum MS-1 TaxID=272627 RepID=A0A0C2UZI3_PARME|nr:hypothetical protein [Paramagnetospirillum magnetotacticum]KIL98231.1 hypothetical protein CCC_01292 [Paramagnetospirillum magnetotacticum MS-1]
MRLLVILSLALTLGACSLVTPDRSAEEARANADIRVGLHTAMTPANACPKVARMLSWCARGPNYHYRCNTTPNGSRAELVGELEAVFRTETFLVVDFIRKGNETDVAVQQRQSRLIYDYPPLIEKHLAGSLDCRPP